MIDALTAVFKKQFQHEPSFFVKSPGRINIIGEHTDYNGGFVLPAAVHCHTLFAVRKSDKPYTRIFSEKFNQMVTLDPGTVKDGQKSSWGRYCAGMLQALHRQGLLIETFDCAISSNIPLGAGLSSSASLTAGFGYCALQVSGVSLDLLTLAAMAQHTEQTSVGANVGIMDPFAVLFGKPAQAIFLNCQTLQHGYIPLSMGPFIWVLVNSSVRHEIASSGYNQRRATCERVLKAVIDVFGPMPALSSVSLSQLETIKDHITPDDFTKAAYVLEENQRVHAMVDALKADNFAQAGELLYLSHQGLSEKYRVSCEELDFLVAEASALDGVAGARMMGGGFGGCTLNLVRKEAVPTFSEHLIKSYRDRYGVSPPILSLQITNGTAPVFHD